MPAKIAYKASVHKDLKQLEPSLARQILTKIETALRSEGRSGTPLAGEFAGLYRFRVKDYRLTYARTTESYLVLRIGHRREVYEHRL